MGLFKKIKKGIKKGVKAVGNVAGDIADKTKNIPGVNAFTSQLALLDNPDDFLKIWEKNILPQYAAGALGGLGVMGAGMLGGAVPEGGFQIGNTIYDAAGNIVGEAGGGGLGGIGGGLLSGLGSLFSGSGSLGALGSLLGLGGNIFGSIQAGNAAQDASQAQQRAAAAGINAQNTALTDARGLLTPFVTAGTNAIGAQGNLVGLNGDDAQRTAISALEASPQFKALLAQGNNSILQNASATGGLRGGNVQGALAQFSPALLAQTINDQFTRLGGISTSGQNAATTLGGFGLDTANSIGNLLTQRGQAQAGGALARGNSTNDLINAIGQGLGSFGANGGFQGLRGLFS